MTEELEDLTLFVRGMNKPSEEIEDIWDDTILNNAYDKALQMANVQVAKRIAMETNSKKKEKVNSVKAKSKPIPEDTLKAATSTTMSEWKPGMPCRAIYDEDGLEYEAIIIKIIDDEDCVVKFLGYDNCERVAINSLMRTFGDDARMRQMEAAMCERDDDGFESQPASEEIDAASDNIEPAVRQNNNNKKKKSNKSSKKKNHSPGTVFGDLPPLPMPTMSMFRNIGADMPMPPPPLASLSERSDAEEQAISDMLLSWYMTGYYTGLYQGMKRQRQSRRCN